MSRRLLAFGAALTVALAGCSDDPPDSSDQGVPGRGPAAPATSSPAAGPNLIAFTNLAEGDPEIFVIAPDGSGQTRLTEDPAGDVHPAWSPDGTRIAFTSDRGGAEAIHVMNADGSDPRPLVDVADPDSGDTQDWAAWSPDGERIAFVEGGGIFTVAADGSDRQTVLEDDAFYRELDWSPDGDTLAYASNKIDGDYEVFAVDVASGEETRLTTLEGFDGNVAWSPDGETIGFSTNDDELQPIALMNADGSNQRALISGSIAIVGGCTFSPDGSRVAFVSSETGDSQLWTIAVDGSGKEQVTEDADLAEFDPQWSA